MATARDVSGCHFRIQLITKHYEKIAVKEARDTWIKGIESLANKYFFDQRGQLKKGIGYDDKNSFIRDINPGIISQAVKLNQTINNYLKLIFQKLDITYLKPIYSYSNLLDSKE